MLVKNNTQIEEGKTIGLRFITGEEVICKVTTANDTEIVIHKPLHLVHTDQGPAFAPLFQMIADDEDPTIYKANVLGHFKPDTKVKDMYESAISDFVLPKSKIIV